jgi:hypothetical protein
VSAEARRFDARFEREFEGLERLSGNTFRRPALRLPAPSGAVAQVPGDARESKRLLDRRENWAVAGKAGVGAVIGTILLPGIGTAIGAAIGGFVGGDARLALRRTTYREKLDPEIRRIVGRAGAEYQAEIQRNAEAARRHLEGRIETYRVRYERAIKDVDSAHARETRKLEKRIAEGRRDALEVDARVELLSGRAETLARIGRCVPSSDVTAVDPSQDEPT